MQEDTRLASGQVVYVLTFPTESSVHRKRSEDLPMGYQEMRGSARRCEEMRANTRIDEVIQGDTRRCVEIRGWFRGMAFRLKFPLEKQQVFVVGGGAG